MEAGGETNEVTEDDSGDDDIIAGSFLKTRTSAGMF
jgi:hypothetical protein